VRSGGLASGIRVVVEIVWKVWITDIVSVWSSEVVWITVVLFSLSDSSVRVGLSGASRSERSEVSMLVWSASAGGSQEGVRA